MGNNKAYKFKDLSITSSTKPWKADLLVETNSSGTLYTTPSGINNMKLYKTTDKGDNWTLKVTRTDTINSAWRDLTNDKIYYIDADAATGVSMWYLDLTDDSENAIGATIGATCFLNPDIWIRDGNLEVNTRDLIAGDLEVWRWVDPNWVVQDTHAIVGEVGRTTIVGTDAYFWSEDAANSIYMLKFDGNNIIELASIANTSQPINYYQWGITYDGDDIIYATLRDDATGDNYLYTYSITGNSWTKKVGYNIAWMLARNCSNSAPNELEKAFDIAKDASNNSRIWEIKARKGGLIQLQTINKNANIIAITDNFLMFAGGEMYEYTDIMIAQTIAEGVINKGIFPIIEQGRFNCHPDDAHFFYNDDSLKVYDDTDELILFAKITDKSRDENGIYQFGLDAYTNELWRRSYVKSYTTDKTSEKQQDNLDNACGFCYRSSSIVATATDYSYEQDRPPMAIFSLGRFMERQVGYAEPDGKVWTKAHDGLTKAPQYYPATYNFRDEDVGTSGTNIGFVDTATLYDGACEIVSDWQGHKKVLRLQDDATAGEDPYFRHNETQANAGTREFWIGTNDVTKYWDIVLYEGGNSYIVRLRISDSALDYQDRATVWQEVQAVANDTIYHVKIIWRADDTFDLWVNEVLKVDNQQTTTAQISGPTYFYIRGSGDSTDYFYFDAWGDVDNDANYDVGDNVVAWDVEINGNLDLINIDRDKPSYYVKKLGITRATCVGAAGISQTYNDATLEDGKAIIPLKEYRDLKIQATTEALQLATALFNVFSTETKFIGLRVVNQEYVQPGKTVNFANTGDISITEADLLVLFYTYDFVGDVYDLMILTDNIALLREFESYFDRSELMVHQNSTAVRENATDIAALVQRVYGGTYTGDASGDDRQIGGTYDTITCVWVVVVASGRIWYWKTPQMAAKTAKNASTFLNDTPRIEIVGGNTFKVSNYLNTNGWVYNYMVFCGG